MASKFDYDNFLIFNPEGTIKQLDYIQKVTQLGNTSIALTNGKQGIIIVHVPKLSKFTLPQEKVFEICDYGLFTFSGITNDGLSIVKYLKEVALEESLVKDRKMHYLDVFDNLNIDATERSLGRYARLYGIKGLLLADYEGIKLVEWDPTGIAIETIGATIGHRGQSCFTILEECYEEIKKASLEELIKIGIRALLNAHPDPEEESLKCEDVHIYVLEEGKKNYTVDPSKYMC